MNKLDGTCNCPIHLAFHHNHPEVIHVLLEYHPDITLRDKESNTPLLLACSRENRKYIVIADKLIQLGADVNITAFTSGNSPLMVRHVTDWYSCCFLFRCQIWQRKRKKQEYQSVTRYLSHVTSWLATTSALTWLTFCLRAAQTWITRTNMATLAYYGVVTLVISSLRVY